MILSNISIHEALDRKLLIIDPEPKPRHVTEGGPKCPYQTTSVDLRLGAEIAYFKSDLAMSVDLRRGNFNTVFGPLSHTHQLTEKQPYNLSKNEFVLAKTLERVELPISDSAQCLAARIEGKSSYARCGLLVHFTAPTIHAGFSGTITLELINLGPLPINLFPHMPICQLIIEQVDRAPFRNDSQFQGQTHPGGR